MKKKIILSLSVIAVVAAITIGVTTAYFQDVETSVGNKFVAGKFNLKIDNTCHYNGKECICIDGAPPCYWNGTPQTAENQCSCTWSAKDLAGELYFNFLDVKPGDNGEDTISLHVDNNDAWVCAEIKNLVKDDNGCDKPESDIDTTCGAGEGELQDNLFFTIWKDTNCDNILDANETVLIRDQKTTAKVWPIADSQHGPVLEGDKTYCLGVKWEVPLATSNIIQSDSLVGDVIFSAVQSRHMANFVCSPAGPCIPQAEVCDGVDNDCDGQIDEGNPGGGGPCDGFDADLCSEGTYSCSAGQLVCSDNTGSTLDLCNGTDDDCDAASADGSEDPINGQACDGADADLCKEGTLFCSVGALVCSDMTGSQVDLCNGLDDDCDPASADGSEDPQNGTACDGADSDLCLEGTRSCSAGALMCSDNTGGNPEICDGLDNDCDGTTDEDCLCDSNDDCDDGLYCNGVEICNAQGTCVSPGNPCPGADGDADCSESCNETNDNCTANDPNGSACNDGIYCNGQDTCASGSCTNHTGNPCPGHNVGPWCNDSCSETFDNCTANDLTGTACAGGVCNSSGTCLP